MRPSVSCKEHKPYLPNLQLSGWPGLEIGELINMSGFSLSGFPVTWINYLGGKVTMTELSNCCAQRAVKHALGFGTIADERLREVR